MSAHHASSVLLQTREKPLVKMVSGHIHEWCKQSAIKSRGGAASLHALYHRNVLSKNTAPGGVQVLTPRPVNLINGGGIGYTASTTSTQTSTQ